MLTTAAIETAIGMLPVTDVATTSEASTNASTSVAARGSSNHDEYSKEVSTVDLYAFLSLMAVYCVMGIVGNSLMLAVFVRRLRRAAGGGDGRRVHGQQYNYFTAALALADLFVCAVVVPYKAAYSLRLIRDDDACKAMQYAAGVSLIFSVLVLVGIAVERYHAVCRPTRPFTGRHAWAIIGVITALGFFGSFPNYLTSSVTASDGRVVGCHFTSGTRPGRTYAAVLAALFVGTLLVTSALYGLVFRVIYKRARGRRAAGRGKVLYQPRSSEDSSSGTQGTDSDARLVLNAQPLRQDARSNAESPAASARASGPSHQSRSNTRVVWMLFGVTFVFFISWVPYWLTSLHVIPYTLTFKYLYYINNCTNFIVYGICNKKIRQEMINRLRCR